MIRNKIKLDAFKYGSVKGIKIWKIGPLKIFFVSFIVTTDCQWTDVCNALAVTPTGLILGN